MFFHTSGADLSIVCAERGGISVSSASLARSCERMGYLMGLTGLAGLPGLAWRGLAGFLMAQK